MAFVGTRDEMARITFKVLPHLGYAPRMLLALAAVAVGIAIQVGGLNSIVALVMGGAFVFFGILLTAVDAKTNEPGKVRGKREWERVTPEEYARVKALVEAGRRWARRDLFGINNAAGCGMFLLLAIVLLGVLLVLFSEREHGLVRVFALDAGLFLCLTFFVGTRKAWTPGDLIVKIDVLSRFLQRQAAAPTPRLTFQPMMEVQKGAKDKQLPLDARLMVTVDNSPADLLGLQIQCSINRVNNTAFPYVYAVIIARKAFNLVGRLQNARPHPKDLLSFEQGDDEVDVAVLRQKTTKTSGYHTKPADQDRIVDHAVQLTLWLANQ